MRGEEISIRATVPAADGVRLNPREARPATTPPATAVSQSEDEPSASPQPASVREAAFNRAQLEEALSSVKERLSAPRMLDFLIDDSTGITVVKVLDQESGDLIRQLPPEQVMVAARVISELTGEGQTASAGRGLLLNEQA